MALQEICPNRGRIRNSDNNYYLCVSSAKCEGGKQITITLSKKAMNDMRWLVGDRVAVFFDPDDNTIHLKRSINGGYKLTCRSPLGNKKKSELSGKSLASGIRFTNPHIIPIDFTPFTVNDCIVEEGLCFIYPVPFQ